MTTRKDQIEAAALEQDIESGRTLDVPYFSTEFFIAGANWADSNPPPGTVQIPRELIDLVSEALKWGIDNMCEHKAAVDELAKYAKMERAFCSCSAWVYRLDTNLMKPALAALDTFLEAQK